MTGSWSSGRQFTAALLLGADGLVEQVTHDPAGSWISEFWTALAGRTGKDAATRPHGFDLEALPSDPPSVGSTWAAPDAETAPDDWRLPELAQVIQSEGSTSQIIFGALWSSIPTLPHQVGQLPSRG